MNDDLIQRIEEHVIKLQDEMVATSAACHTTTIALLREVKEELEFGRQGEEEFDDNPSVLSESAE